MTSYIDRLIQGENLSSSDVTAATEAIASGAVDPTQIAAFLVTFRMKVRNEKKDSVVMVVQTKKRQCVGGGVTKTLNWWCWTASVGLPTTLLTRSVALFVVCCCR
jgi:anthranilate phosphoribosyltransferase